MYKINNKPFKMSRQMMNNNRNTKTNETTRRVPKCLTCEKAGLTGKALEHYTRKTQDPNSPIVCPTILAFKCGYCGQAGHSRGFCQALKTDQARSEREQARRENEEERRRNERRLEDERQRQETSRRLKSNIFTAFVDDEEENERAEELKAQLALQAEQARIQEQEAAFPSLCKMASNKPAPTVQFAIVAKNAAHLPIPKPKPTFKIAEEEPIVYEDDNESEYEIEYDEEDDYTEYVPDTSFGTYVDPYERPAYAAKYFTEEHELEQINNCGSSMLYDYPKSNMRSLAPPRSTYADNDW
jgi:hypothetical protein